MDAPLPAPHSAHPVRPLARDTHPVAYCLLRLALGTCKLSGVLSVVGIAYSPIFGARPMLLGGAFFGLLMVVCFIAMCLIMGIFFLRYSLQAMMVVFLGMNLLIACVLSKIVILCLVGASLLTAFLVAAFIEIACYDPGYGPDLGTSDLLYLKRAFQKVALWQLLSVALVVIFAGCFLAMPQLQFPHFWTATALMFALLAALGALIVRANVPRSKSGE